MWIVVKTLHGLEEVLLKEIQDLGIKGAKIGHRLVEFKGTKKDLYKCNYQLQTALRILVQLRQFQIRNTQALYDAVRRIKWTNYFGINDTFAIDAVVHSKTFNHSQYAALKAKDAIADQFRERFRRRPNVDTKNPTIRIHIHIYEQKMTVLLDSSGQSLHRRGYKIKTVDAPMSEVLAAGIIKLTKWDQKTTLLDPMCGSGTFLGEAYLMANNIPAQYRKKDFGFMTWTDFDGSLWNQVKKDAQKNANNNIEIIRGMDIKRDVSRIASFNLERLNPQLRERIENADFFDSKGDSENPPFVLMNPPYDVRLGIDNGEEFYKKIGDKIKHDYKGSTVWVFSANTDIIKFIGLKPFKKFTLYNGPLVSKLHGFRVY